jgi:hypothetical protein
MAMGYTNRGLFRLLGTLRGEALPTNFFIALVTADNEPDAETNTLGQLTQIATGNGYTSGGVQLTKNPPDFHT